MAPIDKRTCSVCLELFQTPKILPCFHTFCQQCLADLVDTAGTSVTCPQCRRSAPVPSGGVSEFQTNFYIVDEVEHLKKLEYCEEHPDEEIRYYCASCEVPMCRDCHVMEHSRHSVRLLKDVILPAKEDLRNSMQRFHAFTEKKIKADLEKIKERKDGLLKARQAVEQVFDTWEEELKTRVKEACTKARSEALSRFDSDNENIRLVLEEDEQSTEKTKDTIESLQAEVSRALESSNSRTVLALRDDMVAARGSDYRLEKLRSESFHHARLARSRTSSLCTYSNTKIDRGIRLMMRAAQPVMEHIKTVGCMELTMELSTDHDVHSICPLDDGWVWVALGNPVGDGKAILVSPNSRKAKKEEAIKGRISMARLPNGSVLKLKPSNTGVQETRYILSKGNARYAVAVNGSSGDCVIWPVKEGFPITGGPITPISTLTCKHVTAMDANKDGNLFAVLEEGQNHVLIYRCGESQAFTTYNAGGTFLPRDVCFCDLGEGERLVVADWQGDSLHVLDITSTGCSLLGLLGGGCSPLVKPAALCSEAKGLLWIGCSRGIIHSIHTKRNLTSSDTCLSPNKFIFCIVLFCMWLLYLITIWW